MNASSQNLRSPAHAFSINVLTCLCNNHSSQKVQARQQANDGECKSEWVIERNVAIRRRQTMGPEEERNTFKISNERATPNE